MLRHVLVVAVAALVAVAIVVVADGTAAPPSARATCPSSLPAPWRCRTVTVPLDPAGRVRGHLRLAVAEYHRPGPARAAVMAFSGGPGGAGIPPAPAYRTTLAPLLAHRDFVVFDQRGTGVSGELSCPGIQGRARFAAAAVAACGRRLGRRGAFYSSADSAADAEAVRRALHIDKVVLYGVSYGTKTATDYARLYPHHVAAMVLDSVVVADTDPLYRRSAVAAARILRALCRDTRCIGDPVADLETLVHRMRDGVLTGRVAGRRVRITEAAVLNEIVEGGRGRRALPAALADAAAGRLGPLAAATSEPAPDLRGDPWAKRSFSATTYLATTCDDASFPWSPAASLAARRRAARRWLSAQGDADYSPFDHRVASQYGSTSLCLRWPAAGRRPSEPALPDVPALLLSGEEDALTPLEGAKEVAAELPHAELEVVPGRGHVVLGRTGLAAAALRDWAKRLR